MHLSLSGISNTAQVRIPICTAVWAQDRISIPRSSALKDWSSNFRWWWWLSVLPPRLPVLWGWLAGDGQNDVMDVIGTAQAATGGEDTIKILAGA
jgi:hypothetical protein